METPILLSPVALETVSIVTEYIVLETQRLHMSICIHNEKQSSHDRSVLKPSDVSKTGVYRCDYNLKETPLPKVTYFKGLNLYSYANFSTSGPVYFYNPNLF